ncbi:MAG: GNAT family N-acetyltransferase [Acholeplasmatales bacterium]|nr:GNAT family N-acetyltransferase [Acholeplasmatales bacterium]
MDLTLKPKRIGNLYLREIEVSDYLDYFEIGSDLETVKYLNWGPFIKPIEAKYVIEEIFRKRWDDNLPYGYAITLDDRMIGMIDFHSINQKSNSIEIGYFLKRDYWGLGYMRKCASYMVSLAFSMGYDKVVIGSVVDNLRSVRLIESLGFKYEYQTLAQLNNNTYCIANYYAKYKNEE